MSPYLATTVSLPDLVNLDQLDQKLWVALACPVTGLEFDPRTLALVDSDHDGRIRAPELIAAVKWAGGLLKNPDELVKGRDSIPISAINDATPEGKRIASAARQILADLGKKDATEISMADVSDADRIFSNTVFNGDGVIIPEAASDDETKAAINDIARCMGTVTDRSGKPGIDQPKVDAFFAACEAFDAWTKAGETNSATILPAGAGTAAANAAVKAIKAKVDDYFGRCRLAAFDPRSVSILNRKEEEYLAIAATDLSITAEEVANFPLAPVAANKPLPLKGPVNPAHASAVAALYTQAVKPLLGDKSELTEADWLALQEKLAPYDNWMSARAGTEVEPLGIERIRALLKGRAKAVITELIQRDKALEPEAASIANVEKLVRYVRDLHKLCINFVNFKDFYQRREPAIFQAGTLYLDQRACSLVLPVQDAARHAAMAGLAGTYLAYCDCTRKATGETRQIVAAFTNGDSDNLMVGRNGLFYDRQGRDWDATITKVIENPISIRQAFWAPYKKLVRLIEEQVAKRAAAAEAAADTKITTAASTAANVDQAKPEPKKVDVGTVAALGVAFGALGAAFAAIAGFITKWLDLPFWQICLGAVGLLLLISGPSMLIAWLKLRKRNLGPILDANGWAVNSKARINVPFGESLTQIAELPPGSMPPTADRFGDRPSILPKIVLFLIIAGFIYSLLNDFHLIHKWTGGRFGKKPTTEEQQKKADAEADATSVTNAPAATE